MPPLRFPEFTDEWEKQILKEYLEENKTRNTKGWFSKKDVLSVSGDFGIVNQIEYLGRSFAGVSVANYHVVRKGDIVYTKSPLKEYPYGIVKSNKGVDGIVSTLYAVYEPKSNTISDFVEYYFALASRTNKYFKPIVRIGAKHDMKIGNDEVLENFVSFPCLDEQRKISQFLSLIEKRIALQTKIIEDLKKLKSAIIEKLFARGGDDVLISDLITQVSKRNNTDCNLPVLSVNNRLGFIRQSEQFEDRTVASDDTSNYKVVSTDDFAFNPARINVGSIARLKSETNGIVSPMYICFHTNDRVLPEYLEYFFETRYFYSEMQKRLEGSVRLCLSWEGLCNISISLPNIEQQIEIGKKISTIDYKIDLEERYLQNLKLQKQYLLQQMFI